MTTAVLSEYAGELTGNDLQALKDYALEAPWAWRKVFESLIEIAEDDGKKQAELEERLSILREAVSEAVDELREAVKALDETVVNGLPTLKALTLTVTGVADVLEVAEQASERPIPVVQKSVAIR